MLALIVAMTKDRVIGKDNAIPWHISEDFKLFKKVTSGNTIIMGRKTFDSILNRLGKPLPDRNNIIISTSMKEREGIDVCRSFDEALKKAKVYKKEIFVIGGASIYKEALHVVDTMYISYIKKDYKGDILFPFFNKEQWKEVEKKEYDEFDFVILKRK